MEIWSWILTSLGILAIWTGGSGRFGGWLVGVAVQIPWIYFAITTSQYGFVIGSFGYIAVFGQNYLKERKNKRLAEELA